MEENNWLEAAYLDMCIFRLKHRAWRNQEELWRKFVRSS